MGEGLCYKTKSSVSLCLCLFVLDLTPGPSVCSESVCVHSDDMHCERLWKNGERFLVRHCFSGVIVRHTKGKMVYSFMELFHHVSHI